MTSTDIIVVGGGIIGLTIALELNRKYPDLKIILLEKEHSYAAHASGRNSGVIHAGFYYTPDSLKARLTVEGNKLLTDYCEQNNLLINKCGKVVIAKNEHDLKTLYELKKRGDINKVQLKVIDEIQLREIEPNAHTFKKALYSPTTSSIDPIEVVKHIGNTLNNKKNITISFGEKFKRRESPFSVRTNFRVITFGYLINAAGLYADKIAHDFGVGKEYTLIPLKGLYLDYNDDTLIRTHVYPVPNLKNPFLGVHFTKKVNGKVKVGPTAIPALWRENYKGFSNFKIDELYDILSTELNLFWSNSFQFREMVFDEIKKINRNYLINVASGLLKSVDKNKFREYQSSGIRAQLLNRQSKMLVMDFITEDGENSTHILNSVSPAFTCSFSFSNFIVNKIEKKLNML